MGGGQSSQPAADAGEVLPTTKVVKEGHPGASGDVVILPVDQSKQAEAAFEWYYRNIHRPQNKVHVIHCQELEHPGGENYPDYAVTPEDFEDQWKKASKTGSEILSKYKQKLDDYKISGSVHAQVGNPGETVIGATEHHGGTLIVMGTRGYGLVRRTILGSVSEYVVHHTKVPITVVPKDTTHWFF